MHEGTKRKSRGLALLWKPHLNLSLQLVSQNHIGIVHEDVGGQSEWRLIGLYGHLEEEKKIKTWQIMRSLINVSIPWLCFGNFNEILYNDEKKGGKLKTQATLDAFGMMVNACDLHDLGFMRHPFTWFNNQQEGGNVQERMDLFSGKRVWLQLFY